jgi:hypothetical protein
MAYTCTKVDSKPFFVLRLSTLCHSTAKLYTDQQSNTVTHKGANHCPIILSC